MRCPVSQRGRGRSKRGGKEGGGGGGALSGSKCTFPPLHLRAKRGKRAGKCIFVQGWVELFHFLWPWRPRGLEKFFWHSVCSELSKSSFQCIIVCVPSSSIASMWKITKLFLHWKNTLLRSWCSRLFPWVKQVIKYANQLFEQLFWCRT